MFGVTRWNPYQDLFDFQREVDRAFSQFWSALPSRTAAAPSNSFHVNADENGWHVEVPLPGFDPKNVTLEVAGTTLFIRAQETVEGGPSRQFEQAFTVPRFLDVNRITASYRHGMLDLTLPLRESEKPRRIQIETAEPSRQLTGAAA